MEVTVIKQYYDWVWKKKRTRIQESLERDGGEAERNAARRMLSTRSKQFCLRIDACSLRVPDIDAERQDTRRLLLWQSRRYRKSNPQINKPSKHSSAMFKATS